MQMMIEDLLAYSRVETHSSGFSSVDCNRMVKDALTLLRLSIQESGATLDYEGLPTLDADPRQLRQLFPNLIGNAIKYAGDAPPHVQISAVEEAWKVVFAVRDNGVEIAPEFYEQVFILFRRLKNETHAQGSGVGLALCKRIVERHGGRIWLESSPGSGSVFCFSLTKTCASG